MRVRSLLIGLAAACCCVAAQARSEHPQRLAAEIVVMAGDVRRLTDYTGTPLEGEGLVKRMNGALASLPLLLRRANDNSNPVAGMRALIERRDWRALSVTLAALKQRHPFDTRRLLLKATPELSALGMSIHSSTCAGCHDTPSAESLLPAKHLGEQFASMPRQEFAARLLLGVRGDKVTAYVNPFSELELAALIVWYGQGR